MLFGTSDGAQARNKDLKAVKEISASTSRQEGSKGSKHWNITELMVLAANRARSVWGGKRNIKQK